MPRLDCLQTPDPSDAPDALQKIGPTIIVTVQSPILVPNTPPQSEPVHALIDTGAQESHIDADLAQRLGLPVIDQQPLAGVGGVKNHDVVVGEVLISELGTSITGRFVCVHMEQGGQLHKVIIGRSFLQNCVMVYDGVKGSVVIVM